MDPSVVAIIVAIASMVTTLGGGLLLWVRYRRKDRIEERAIELTNESQQNTNFSENFKSLDDLNKWADERMQSHVKPLEAKIEKYEDERKEFSVFLTQLVLWESQGRPGAMPQIPEALLESLQLSHLVHLINAIRKEPS